MAEAGRASDGDWCERFAASLSGAGVPSPVTTAAIQALLLRMAGDIAHSTERKNAPVAAFIAGQYVEARRSQGVAAEAALDEAAEVVARLLRDATR